jgi:DNA (cytosine-5)-methyltransferase 1
MKYISICSGIEAASVAWHPLRWSPVAFAETEAFPRAVLAHHYPGVPNWGDVNGFKEWPLATVDVLVGGTPCQSFSVAGLRRGMADPRGNLALVYLAIAQRYRPEWLVWENVPGVLSSNGGRDFGAFIGGLEQLGYHAAWRVLDAQYVRVDGYPRAVPQRRRRVFVVGHSDWRRAAAVLFERESLSGHSPPRRQAGERAAPTIASRTTGGGGLGTDFDCEGGLIAFGGNDTSGPIDVATARNAHAGPHGRLDFESETFIAHALRADGFDSSEDGTGRGVPLVSFQSNAGGQGGEITYDVSITLKAQTGCGNGMPAIAFDARQSDVIQYGDRTGPLDTDGSSIAVAFDMRGREGGSQLEGPHDTANIRAANGGSSKSYVAQSWAVRRLTPLECERLQGFPDGYTAVPYRGRPAADGPRYKALGNSMAVNCMSWIGRRIEMVAGM